MGVRVCQDKRGEGMGEVGRNKNADGCVYVLGLRRVCGCWGLELRIGRDIALGSLKLFSCGSIMACLWD